MTKLSQYARSPHSPSPIFGIAPGFTVGDLEKGYTPYLLAIGTAGANTDGSLTVTGVSITTTSTAINANARAVKIVAHVTAGSGSVTLTVKSNVDAYATTIATYTGLTVAGGDDGTYELFLGGYGTQAEFQTSRMITPELSVEGVNNTLYPSSDSTSYVATRYGPTKPGLLPAVSEDETNPDPSADSNYMGGTYNPFQFLSLDGYALEITGTVTGTVTFDVEVVPIS
jgi:hypothetical protein